MKILVVEDNQQHIDSAKKFFAEKGIEMWSTETLKGFISAIGDDHYDGVLSDVFFSYDGKYFPDEVPAGVAVLFICQSRGIPCVLVTDGYHHGKKYQWIHYMLNELRLPLMIDNMGDDSEAPEKNWAMALKSLASVIGHKQCLILGAE